MTSKLTITDERLAELVAFKPLPGTDINSATRDEWMAMAAELQERRRADSEPVAEVVSMFGDPEVFGERELKLLVGIQNMPYGTKFYRHAQQPVVENEPVAEVLSSRPGNDTSTIDRALPVGTQIHRHAQPAPVVPDTWPRKLIWSHHDDIARAEVLAWNNAIDACRAAMLQAQSCDDYEPTDDVPDGVVTAEHQRVIEMLLKVCGAAFELADDTCECELDGEQCITAPSDSFAKLSEALDEIENTLPTEDADRPDVFLAWAAMPRAALKSILQAGNSPVIPDCWCQTCRPVTMNDMRFVVCPDCGNKRCPHASDHRHACTGSNEPGQEGSAYAAAPQEVTSARVHPARDE